LLFFPPPYPPFHGFHRLAFKSFLPIPSFSLNCAFPGAFFLFLSTNCDAFPYMSVVGLHLHLFVIEQKILDLPLFPPPFRLRLCDFLSILFLVPLPYRSGFPPLVAVCIFLSLFFVVLSSVTFEAAHFFWGGGVCRARSCLAFYAPCDGSPRVQFDYFRVMVVVYKKGLDGAVIRSVDLVVSPCPSFVPPGFGFLLLFMSTFGTFPFPTFVSRCTPCTPFKTHFPPSLVRTGVFLPLDRVLSSPFRNSPSHFQGTNFFPLVPLPEVVRFY